MMNILIEGENEADYLAKCHEAFRNGLRSRFNVRSFGKGYSGFYPNFRTFREIINHTFPDAPPDILLPAFEISPTASRRFGYDGLREIDIPKAILIGDFWNITEHYADEFSRLLERERVDMAMCYFPQPLEIFAKTEYAERFAFLPPCVDPAIFNDWKEEKRYDVGFLAAGTTELTAFYPERFSIHEQLLRRKEWRYLWANHPGWHRANDAHPLVGQNFSKAINSCKIFLTTSGKYRHPNPKYMEILASGAMLMADKPKGAEAIHLQDGVNYVEISPDDVLDKIEYYLARPELTQKIARAGYEMAMQFHTNIARARDFEEAARRIIPSLQSGKIEGNKYKKSEELERKIGIKVGINRDNSQSSTTQIHATMNTQSNDPIESVFGIPHALLMDSNIPLPIRLSPNQKELPTSSSPQYTLYRLVRHLKPKKILEIGSQIGASAVAMAYAQRDNGMAVDITCIDPFLPTGDNDGMESLARWYNNVVETGYLAEGIKLIMTFSNQFLPFTKEKFDFIIIDGSHHYEDVRYDLEHSLPICAENGAIWMHDYVIYHHTVGRAIDEIAKAKGLEVAVNPHQSNDRGDVCGWAFLRPSATKQNAVEVLGNYMYRDKRGLKLHLGSGADYWHGYVNIDAGESAKADIIMNFTDIDTVFSPNSVSEAVMIHAINYLTLWEARKFFRTMFSLFQDGGKLVIETVNLEAAGRKFLDNMGNFTEYLEGVRGIHGFGLDHLAAEEMYAPNKFSWTAWHLRSELEAAGFTNVALLPAETHSPWRDMRVTAEKKNWDKTEGSRKSEVESWKSEVESRKSEVESRKSEVESRKSEVESWKSEVESWKSEVESRKSEVESRDIEPQKNWDSSTSLTDHKTAQKASVLFVLDPQVGHVTVHLRGLMFKELFAERGWNVEFVDVRQMNEDDIVELSNRFDIVYLLKIPFLRLVEKLRFFSSAKTVFDLTDALWKPYHREHGWQDLESILMRVDAIFSENEWICEYGQRYNPVVYSIPVCTQVEKFDILRKDFSPENDGKIRVLWLGSTGTVQALEKIRVPLERLARKYPHLELRVVGCADESLLPKFAGLRVSSLPHYNEDDMLREALSADIGIFPPPFDIEDYEVRGALKGMIYMTAGKPVVWQNAGDCTNFVVDGENGMLADSLEEWEQKLDALISSAERRAKMGENALATMRAEHSLSHVFDVLTETLLAVKNSAFFPENTPDEPLSTDRKPDVSSAVKVTLSNAFVQEMPSSGKKISSDFRHRVTLGIPTRNRLQPLLELIDSITKQTFQNFDLLISDDGNMYNLGKEIRAVFPDLAFRVVKGPAVSLPRNRQNILDCARTEFVVMCDDDHVLVPHCLEYLYETMNSAKDIGIVSAVWPHENDAPIDFEQVKNEEDFRLDMGNIDEDSHFWWRNGWRTYSSKHSPDRILEAEFSGGGCQMYRKSAVQIAGGFPTDYSTVSFREDTDISHRIFLKNYRLLIDTRAVAYHHPMATGGCRDASDVEISREKDGKLFLKKLAMWRAEQKKAAEMNFRHSPVRVLILYDEEGWAWWHRAHAIKNNISADIHVDVVQANTLVNHHTYDFVLLFDHNLLKAVPYIPTDKIIIGNSCPIYIPQAAESILANGVAAGLVNNYDGYKQLEALVDEGWRKIYGENPPDGILKPRIFSCQNGVNTELFYPNPNPPQEFTACWVGNSASVGNKGLEIIREACRIAGVPLLIKDAKGAGGKHVSQEEIRNELYWKASVYLNASEYEGTPNPALEALACGVPVISTHVGNLTEVIVDGWNGYLIERSAESMAKAIVKLKNWDKTALSRNARSSMENGYTWREQVRRYEWMFKELKIQQAERNPLDLLTSEKRTFADAGGSVGRGRMKIAGEYNPTGADLTQIGAESEFARALAWVFEKFRPMKIIETGTYLGEGTTREIARNLQRLGMNTAEFFSIEINPQNLQRAMNFLQQAGLLPYVKLLNGVSLPRNFLPTLAEIQKATVEQAEFDDIFVDHQENERALKYYQETDFSGGQEDLLGLTLLHFGNKPDLVLLDSGGHIGFAEFSYLISRLQAPCVIVLDDVYHIKHHKSFRWIQSDPRFEVLVSSKEKFGFCVARFSPSPESRRLVQNILWVRTDSIGDNVLASAQLPHIHARFPHAKLTVLCQAHIAELYRSAPFVSDVIPFEKNKMLADEAYRNAIMRELQIHNFDLTINSVYSRQQLTDFFVIAAGARERIGWNGDFANGMDEKSRTQNNPFYSRLLFDENVQAEEISTELGKHRAFLRWMGIDAPELQPTVWISADDERFADDFFRNNGLLPDKTIVLFAGAQVKIRWWNGYGKALAELCKEQDFAVIALGSSDEALMNAENLREISGKTVNLCGQTTLGQSAALLKKARLAVGAETGLAHIACAVGTPNVILLGGGHFGRFMPYSPLTSVVSLPLDCFRCDWHCRYPKVHCVQDILPETFAKAIRQALEQNRDISTWFDYSHQPSLNNRHSRIFIQEKGDFGAGKPRYSEEKIGIKAGEIIRLGESADRHDIRVSAIVSVYKAGTTLRGRLENLVRQTLFRRGELEIIVIDAHSPEDEGAIVREFQQKYPNILYERTDERITIYAAWNKAIARARGTYITNQNADDRMIPSALETLADYLDRNPETPLVHAEQVKVPQGTEADMDNLSGEGAWQWHPFSRIGLVYSTQVGSQPMWRRSLHEQFGFFDEEFTSRGDQEFFARIAKVGDFAFIPKILGTLAFSDDSLSQNAAVNGREQEEIFLRYTSRERIADFLGENLKHPADDGEYQALCNMFVLRYLHDASEKGIPVPVLQLLELLLSVYDIPTAREKIARNCLRFLRAINNEDFYRKITEDWDSVWLETAEKTINAKPDFEEIPLARTHIVLKQNTQEFLNRPRVSIIIPVRNNVKFTRQCLESVWATTRKGETEIIVIDNASSDETPEYLQSLGEKISVIRNEKNESFSYANNQGARIARGDYLLFLNNDTELLPHWLSALTTTFEEKPEVGIQGAKLLYDNGMIQHAGIVCGNIEGYLRHFHLYLLFPGEEECVNKARAFQFVTGAFLAIRRPLFEEIGGFDEEYVYGHEDLDLCLSVRKKGFLVWYNPAVRAYHFEAMTKKSDDIEKFSLHLQDEDSLDAKNHRYFLKKWGNPFEDDATKIYIEDGFIAPNFSAPLPPEAVRANARGKIPRVTAIVSTYNSERFMRGCMENLIRQSLFQRGEMEIVVIDANSQKNERTIVEDFARFYPNIFYEKAPVRENIYASWNRGMRLARGEFVCNCNTDDKHRSDALEKLASALETSQAGIAYSDLGYGQKENVMMEHAVRGIWRLPDFMPAIAVHYNLGCFTIMWRKSAHAAIGGFNEQFSLAGDFDFFTRVGLEFGAVHVREPLTMALLHAGQQSKNEENMENQAEAIRLAFTQLPLEKLFPNVVFSEQAHRAEAYCVLANVALTLREPWYGEQSAVKIPAAVEWCERALAVVPNYDGAIYTLALISAIVHQHTTALSLMERYRLLAVHEEQLYRRGLAFIAATREGVDHELMRHIPIYPANIFWDKSRPSLDGESTVKQLSEAAEREKKPSPKAETTSQKGMTILFTMYGWNESGGGTTFPKSVAKRLVREGNRVVVFCANQSHPAVKTAYTVECATDEGVEIVGVFNRPTLFLDADNPAREVRDERIVAEFSRLLGEIRPDVVHFHNFLGLSFAIADEVKKRGIPSLYTPHNYHLIDPTLYLFRSDLSLWKDVDLFANSEVFAKNRDKRQDFERRIETAQKLLTKTIDLTIAVSTRQKELLSEFCSDGERIAVVNQIHESAEMIATRREHIRPRRAEKPVRFAFIGGVMPHKGVHIAVLALQQLAPGSAEFWIYGFCGDAYKQQLNAFDVNRMIRWKGAYREEELAGFASDIDAIITPSVWEDCAPLVLAEALAMGVPVIASRLGGITDFIRDGWNGRLYRHDSMEELAGLLEHYAENPEELGALRKNCRIPYGFSDYIAHILLLYRRLLAGEFKIADNASLNFLG